ncbi:hypothetical protein [Microbacterium sp. No. 7]|uniref:hypothetical protein n=1 Tax=Microbacterium sp. No. 7 TaxID=1714373 RepID=UPI0006D0DF2E|nr:hypothetical protein [Microbacterium sp. No. 7]
MGIVPDDGSTTSRAGHRWRSALATALLIVSVLLAPVAVLGAWARIQLVDTDRFVETLAPLAADPAVQGFVADQAAEAIEQSVDIDGLVGDLFAGIASLGLPPRSAAALALLEGPAAQGVRSLIATGADRLVTSPQFEALWERALREAHGRTISVLQDDPDGLVRLDDDGVLSLQLGTVIGGVTARLSDQGIRLAERVPDIEWSVPLVASDALPAVRTAYQATVAVGLWLPWAVLALATAGVLCARNRLRALAWTGAGLSAAFLALVAALGLGRRLFLDAVSPATLPEETASAFFDQATELLSSALLVAIVLSLVVAIGAGLAGRSRAVRRA